MIEVTTLAFADFHTHTRFSDGRNTIGEMAEEAVLRNMYALGFTDHSPMEFEQGYADRQAWLSHRTDAICALKKEYEGRLEIFAGLELDVNTDIDLTGLDYVIEGNHFLHVDGEYLPTDWSAKHITDAADKHFGGDIFGYFSRYYEEMCRVGDRGPAVVGHFDVVAKFNEGECMFAEDDPRYLSAALSCVEVLAKKDVIFEVNTGNIFRGLRTKPFPSIPILKRMHELGCALILGGDSHCKEALCGSFDDALEYIALAGYTGVERYPIMRGRKK